MSKTVLKVDYSQLQNWAAHPSKSDEADKVPTQSKLADQSNLKADVFFVHPTTYTGKKSHDQWNPSIEDIELNERTDQSTIKFQASIFNQAGRVFAPRYRQAHLHAYYTKDKSSAKNAFELAYNDVKRSFEYYLAKENKGRPFIIASHSQGTTHCKRLIKELVDGKALQNQLIAAYLIGIPVLKSEFENIKPCESADDIGCSISWRTFKHSTYPKSKAEIGDQYLVTNPLSWTTDNDLQDKSRNTGAVLRNFDKVLDQRVDAQINDGILWAHKPKFPFSFLLTRDNYHVADLNFYYMNVQANAVNRVQVFLNKNRDGE